MEHRNERNDVRLVCWNVNGLRAVSRKFGGVAKFLESLEADIVCIQETKLAKSELDRELALVEGWESFFSFCTTKTGYSGVATFCRTSITMPLACSSSLCGPPLAGDGSGGVIGLEGMDELESEGRFVATDHGKFVLMNIYAPAITSEERVEERMDYKLRWYKALRAHTDALVEHGQNVVLVGDFNVSPYPIDHCDPCEAGHFCDRPDRAMFHSMLKENGGKFFDVFRKQHPHRKNAFTCWSQASGARVNNYGTRIDMVLAAPGQGRPANTDFLECFLDTDIWSDREGSDHAPIFARMNLGMPLQCSETPPLGSSRHLFPGKQRLLDCWVKSGCKVSAEAAPCDTRCAESKSKDIQLGTNTKPTGVRNKRKQTQLGLHQFLKKTRSMKGVEQVLASNIYELPQFQQGTGCASGPSIVAESQIKQREQSMAAWKGIFDRMKPPLCRGHAEPCVIREVKKPGENKGRLFFVCARPAGPPPIGRCNFFQWRNGRTVIGDRDGSAKKSNK